MCKEFVVAPCYDLFASYRHHQLPRYYSAYEVDQGALGQNSVFSTILWLTASNPLLTRF